MPLKTRGSTAIKKIFKKNKEKEELSDSNIRKILSNWFRNTRTSHSFLYRFDYLPEEMLTLLVRHCPAKDGSLHIDVKGYKELETKNPNKIWEFDNINLERGAILSCVRRDLKPSKNVLKMKVFGNIVMSTGASITMGGATSKGAFSPL